MNGRKTYKWNVRLANDGEQFSYPVECYWSPSWEGVDEEVARTARAQAAFELKRNIQILSVERI